MKEINLFNSLK